MAHNRLRFSTKQDNNFIENPLSILDTRAQDNSYKEIVLKHGTYKLSWKKAPNTTDELILLALLHLADKAGSHEFYVSRYAILKLCGFTSGGENYKRMWDSIRRWRGVDISLDGCFYVGGGKYVRKAIYGVIDEAAILKDDSKMCRIRLGKTFWTLMSETQYYTYIDLMCLRRLKSGLARKIYILGCRYKSAGKTSRYKFETLVQKLTVRALYPSKLDPRIDSAISEINSKTDINVELLRPLPHLYQFKIKEKPMIEDQDIEYFDEFAEKPKKKRGPRATPGMTKLQNEIYNRLIDLFGIIYDVDFGNTEYKATGREKKILKDLIKRHQDYTLEQFENAMSSYFYGWSGHYEIDPWYVTDSKKKGIARPTLQQFCAEIIFKGLDIE